MPKKRLDKTTRIARRRARIRAFRTLPAIVWIKEILRSPVGRWHDRQTDFRFQLAVAAIFKDEARFLDEWLTFHHGVGVEHFYLYNNRSSDGYREVLSPWIETGIVTLIDWPRTEGQLHAYNNCLWRFRKEARWIALIDVDEFLFSPRGRDIRAFLGAYNDLSAIFVYWHMFGSSGHLKRPPGSVIASYTRRLGDSELHPIGKSIVNPRLTRKAENPHIVKTWVGATLDENRRPPPFGPDRMAAVPSRQMLRINHYWSRSIEDLHEKVRRGDASSNLPRDLARHLKMESTLNAVEDRTILPLWEEIMAEHQRIQVAS